MKSNQKMILLAIAAIVIVVGVSSVVSAGIFDFGTPNLNDI